MKKYHFIAIGGSAMHSLAIALKKSGDLVTGSDDFIFDPSLTKLKKAGICPDKLGWDPKKINLDLNAVIVGMHAKFDNPELLTAQKLGLKIYSYPEFLTQFSINKTRVVIAGSHGKTTISAMILHVLKYHDISIDFMVGAGIDGYENSVSLSKKNDFILLEGDEYLSSPLDLTPKFHHYKPQIALISGIAWDHINVFKTELTYQNQFNIFIESITPGGVLVYNQEDKILSDIVSISKSSVKKQSYGMPEHFTDSNVTYLDTNEGALPLKIFGKHNLLNISGAKWVCQLMGVEEDDFYQAISNFNGAKKRLERIASVDNSCLLNDFAHSPSKVRASIDAVKNQFHKLKLIACLELHTFSSLDLEYMNQYRDSLNKVDFPIIFYNPSTLKISDSNFISDETIKKAFNDFRIIIFTNTKKLEDYLSSKEYKNSVLLMMSSGNFGDINMKILKNKFK